MRININRLTIEFVLTIFPSLVYFKPANFEFYIVIILLSILSSLVAEIVIYQFIDKRIKKPGI